MPTLAELYSDTNVLNSVAQAVAAKFLAGNYLVYWPSRDVLQTPDGSYMEWSTKYSIYMADATFLARVTAADGMVSLVEALSAAPKWILRPITTAGPIPQDTHLLPVISIEVSAAQPVRPYELGTTGKWRYRTLMLDGYVRTRAEQRKFIDWFGIWLDPQQFFTVQDHDSGSLATVGDAVECTDTNVRHRVDPIAVEPSVYQVIGMTRLVYLA